MATRKVKYFIGFVALLVLMALSLLIAQRREQSILAELIHFTGNMPWGSMRVTRFVIKNDGTLVYYFGDSSNHRNMRRNIVRRVHESATIRLSDEDFRDLYEMIDNVSENYHIAESGIRSMSQTFLLYNDYIYGEEFQSALVFELFIELHRLLNAYRVQ